MLCGLSLHHVVRTLRFFSRLFDLTVGRNVDTGRARTTSLGTAQMAFPISCGCQDELKSGPFERASASCTSTVKRQPLLGKQSVANAIASICCFSDARAFQNAPSSLIGYYSQWGRCRHSNSPLSRCLGACETPKVLVFLLSHKNAFENTDFTTSYEFLNIRTS